MERERKQDQRWLEPLLLSIIVFIMGFGVSFIIALSAYACDYEICDGRVRPLEFNELSFAIGMICSAVIAVTTFFLAKKLYARNRSNH